MLQHKSPLNIKTHDTEKQTVPASGWRGRVELQELQVVFSRGSGGGGFEVVE